MSLKRTIVLLGSGILVMMASMPVAAQDLWGLQLFAPAEVTPYGGAPRANEGFFFSWDGLRWSITTPEIADIGLPNGSKRSDYEIGMPPDYDLFVDRRLSAFNSMNTGELLGFPVSGDRFEFGRIVNRHGWMVSTYHLKPQSQYLYGSDVSVIFDDPQAILVRVEEIFVPEGEDPPVPPYVFLDQPVIYSEIVAKNSVETWSVELSYVKRSYQLHHGGYFELFGGVRYMEFDEDFWVEGSGPDAAVAEGAAGGVLGTLDALNDSYWATRADNHIVGPQVGLRWWRKRGRWMVSTEGRFLAGYNAQTIRQQGTLGTKVEEALNNGYVPTGFNSRRTLDEFSPCAELRAELRWQATKAVSFRAGWTGIWINNIARPSNMVRYEVPYMGIDTSLNRQDVFINGLTIGVDINR